MTWTDVRVVEIVPVRVVEIVPVRVVEIVPVFEKVVNGNANISKTVPSTNFEVFMMSPSSFGVTAYDA
jgi:hypothetical protein